MANQSILRITRVNRCSLATTTLRTNRHRKLNICRIIRTCVGIPLILFLLVLCPAHQKALAVSCHDSNIRHLRALVLGPPESPYQFGFYEFSIKFGKDYPASPPSVWALTTNYGKCRFNPNIYACGKVCLSILGTWRGNNGEEWSSAQGLESILISIQSLLSSNPYENEPGYEDASSKPDQDNMKNYVAKIRHENLRLAVIEPLERALGIGSAKMIEQANQMDGLDDDDDDIGPGAFSDLRKSRFLWYYECYLLAIAEGEAEKNRKRKFGKMPFEGPGNIMDGHFDYPELRQRLETAREAIMAETKAWSVEGRAAQEQEAGIAANLVRQREQIVEIYKARSNFTVDLHLADGNPFVWELTYFGRPMTQLDGGIFNFIIHLSPRFPEEQPRVFVQPPLFHYRVSNHGVLCYFPEGPEEMQNHVDAIVAALEEEAPYDPRATVNPEATRLFWGSPDDRKQYNRRLRRSVERSTETCA